ncbi:Glycerophosphoryl diester phosphodiesterase [Hordeum vulgare]|nr:Glycerophosphoryl diester phosphodiesterase [Hordeum vulgare]
MVAAASFLTAPSPLARPRLRHSLRHLARAAAARPPAGPFAPPASPSPRRPLRTWRCATWRRAPSPRPRGGRWRPPWGPWSSRSPPLPRYVGRKAAMAGKSDPKNTRHALGDIGNIEANNQHAPWATLPTSSTSSRPKGHTSVIVLMLIFLGGSDANPAARRHSQLDRAIEEGADFIETDILASKDGHLICSHDVILDTTTDIANRTEFTGRNRTYDVQGVKLTGWFIGCLDLYYFLFKCLYKYVILLLLQLLIMFSYYISGKYNILTFDEFILIALHADRVVGIYPEIKNPIFINQHVKWSRGKKFEDKFVETLLKYGYKGEYMSKDWLKKPLFILSFAPTSLIYISNMTNAPKLLLIYPTTVPTEDTNQVHPYTFRNENSFLHFNFHQDPYAEYEYWLREIGVDALFTDFTGSLHKYQEWTAPHQRKEKKCTGTPA